MCEGGDNKVLAVPGSSAAPWESHPCVHSTAWRGKSSSGATTTAVATPISSLSADPLTVGWPHTPGNDDADEVCAASCTMACCFVFASEPLSVVGPHASVACSSALLSPDASTVRGDADKACAASPGLSATRRASCETAAAGSPAIAVLHAGAVGAVACTFASPSRGTPVVRQGGDKQVAVVPGSSAAQEAN